MAWNNHFIWRVIFFIYIQLLIAGPKRKCIHLQIFLYTWFQIWFQQICKRQNVAALLWGARGERPVLKKDVILCSQTFSSSSFDSMCFSTRCSISCSSRSNLSRTVESTNIPWGSCLVCALWPSWLKSSCNKCKQHIQELANNFNSQINWIINFLSTDKVSVH